MTTVIVTTASGTTDISNLCKSINISGDYHNCARICTFSIPVAYGDSNIPVVDCPIGAGVSVAHAGQRLFVGNVYTKEKGTDKTLMTVVCFDYGFRLKKVQASYKFSGQTPEQITRRICSEYGLTAGSIAATGISVKRKFMGATLYSVIMTAYTLAAEKNGKSYVLRFDGEGRLQVLEKSKNPIPMSLDTGKNIVSLQYYESTENMVNRVVVQNNQGVTVKTFSNDENIKAFGLMQSVMTKSKDGDTYAKAKKLLEDSGIDQRITVRNVGDTSFLTGSSLLLTEPYTGLKGLFWIDSDIHNFTGGSYTNQLTLNFRNIMDEQEGGSEK